VAWGLCDGIERLALTEAERELILDAKRFGGQALGFVDLGHCVG
jgi:hypothetical protein